MLEADRFQPGRPRQLGNQADTSWAIIFYRGAAALAALILMLAAANYLYNVSQNRPLIPLMPLVVAGAIYLIGYGLRYVFGDR